MIRVALGKDLLERGVVPVDFVVEMYGSRLVGYCRSIQDEHRNWLGKIDLDVVLARLHGRTDLFQRPFRLALWYPRCEFVRLLHADAPVAEVAPWPREFDAAFQVGDPPGE